MAASLTLKLFGDIVSATSGTKHIEPPFITSNTALETTTVATLFAGDNFIAVPATATVCVIVPPAGNTQTLKLKGAGGDTGVAISKTNFQVLSFDTSPPANVVINAGGTVTGCVFNFA